MASPKIAAALILYHPGKDLLANIASYYQQVERLYVFDNTEQDRTGIDWAAYPKVVYHHDGVNRGLAVRLNAAATQARADGYRWLLTMDQDSSFTPEAISHYIRYFDAYPLKEQVALFGPGFCSEHQGKACTGAGTEVKHIITSGALTNLDYVAQLGGFDEALFIDCVDCDYCIRARLGGYKLVQFPSVFMQHAMGAPVRRSSIKTLYLYKKSKSLHAPVRYYYMYRNYLYLKDKYRGQDLEWVQHIGNVVRSRVVTYLLYGRNSLQLLRQLRMAYLHYRTNRMGARSGS